MVWKRKKWLREAMIITSAPYSGSARAPSDTAGFHGVTGVSSDKESDFLRAFVNLWNYPGEQQRPRRRINSAVCVAPTNSELFTRVSGRIFYTQLRQVVKNWDLCNSEPAEYREIHVALLTGLLSASG